MTEPNAFTGAALEDRGSDSRRQDPRWVAAQHRDPHARAVVAGSAGLHVADGRLALVPLAELARGARALLLGRDALGPVFAYDEDSPPADGVVPPMVAAGGRRGEPPAESGDGRVALREAAALLNWHRRHRFCAVCGRATDVSLGGLVRVCPRCGATHHPRTDPVVIMLVVDGDRVLLGRQPSWPQGRYSALAGFVAPVYEASQPWPFPSSLMLGFHVPWASGEPDASDDELQDARWFSRAEIKAAARDDADDDWETPGDPGDELRLPPRLAIARRLIEAWLSR